MVGHLIVNSNKTFAEQLKINLIFKKSAAVDPEHNTIHYYQDSLDRLCKSFSYG